MAGWIQKGYAVISDHLTEDASMPFLHSFSPAKFDAEQVVRMAARLPEHLRRNMRIVEGELSFDDAKPETN